MSLNWNTGDAIARCDGGSTNKRILHLNLDDTNKDFIEVTDPCQYLNDDYFKGLKKNLKVIDLNKLYACLRNKRPPESNSLNEIYLQALEYLNTKSKTEVILSSGKFVPLPPKKLSSRIYIAGPSESGKSTYASSFIKEIFKNHKNRKFYIFSVLVKDDVLDKLNPIRIKCDTSMVEKPIELKELEESIVLFDDILTITDKKVRISVANLRDKCLSEGRHHNITCISTNHQITDYKNTRDLLLESSHVTFFPKSGGVNGIKRFLTAYCGLDKKECQKILKLPSRWVTVYKSFPNWCLYETGCFLLGQDTIEPIKIERTKPIKIQSEFSDNIMIKKTFKKKKQSDDNNYDNNDDNNYFTEDYYSESDVKHVYNRNNNKNYEDTYLDDKYYSDEYYSDEYYSDAN